MPPGKLATWPGGGSRGQASRTRVRTANVAWLSPLPAPAVRSPGVARLLLKVFEEPAPLMGGATAVGDPLSVLPVLFHLMWQHVLSADLDARLTSGSLVTVGSRAAGSDLAGSAGQARYRHPRRNCYWQRSTRKLLPTPPRRSEPTAKALHEQSSSRYWEMRRSNCITRKK